MRYELNTDFDPAAIVQQLEMQGGVSFPILNERDRQELLAAALTYEYVRQPQVVGAAQVKQDMWGVDALPVDSPLCDLRDDWQILLDQKMREVAGHESLFQTPVCFNELSLQRYEPGSFGITPHRDSSCNINLICIFVLTGYSRFGLCEDRQGTKIITHLDDSPGRVILLRAPGFHASRPQPFHFLTDIPELRISLGLRQVIS